MEKAPEEVRQSHNDVVVSVPSSDQLTYGDCPLGLSCLEVKRKSRLYNYLYGPFRQHQFLVNCVQKLKKHNNTTGKEETPGRMLSVGPDVTGPAQRILSQLMWYISIGAPFLFILLDYICYNTWMACCCAIILCLSISVHSVAIFFILHNHKISKRFWFVNKVDLDHRCGRENEMVKVSLEDMTSLQLLSEGRKSQVIAWLAQSQDKKGHLMLCTRSFWISRVLDPLLCFLFLIMLSLITLIIHVDLLRKHHML